jgi:hypothetical protein
LCSAFPHVESDAQVHKMNLINACYHNLMRVWDSCRAPTFVFLHNARPILGKCIVSFFFTAENIVSGQLLTGQRRHDALVS